MQCFRAARSSNFERLGGAERARAAILSAPVEPSGLERPFQAPLRRRAGSSGHFEPAEPSGLDVANVGRCGVFEARPSRTEPARAAMSSAPAEPSGFERPFRAPWRRRAGSSGHFERGAERARAAVSSATAEPSGLEVANVGRCGVFEPSRAELGWSRALKPPKPERRRKL